MTSTGPGRVVQFGAFQLDLHSGELEQHGRRVLLAEQPFRLLALLIREPGTLVTREDLRRELWPDGTFVDFEPSLNAAVKRVREALGDSAVAPQFIETLPRRGYRFIAPVREVTEHADSTPAGTRPVVAAPAEVDRPGSPASYVADAQLPDGPTLPVRGTARLRKQAAVVLAIGLLSASALTFRSLRTERTLPSGESRIERLTSDGTVRLAAVSLDGRDLAYVRRDGLRESLWLKRRGDAFPTRLLEPVDGTFRSLTFAGAETLHYMLFRPDRTSVMPFSISTLGGSPQALLEPAGRISFNRDGSRCAYVQNFSLTVHESRIVVARADGSDPRVIVRRPPYHFLLTKPAWSPDGSRLVVFGFSEANPTSPELLVVDVANGKVLKASPIALVAIEGAVWLPDADHLVISGRERSGVPQRLWLFSFGAQSLRPITSDLSDYSLAGLSAEGLVVAVRGEVARSIWVAESRALTAPEEVAQNAGDLGELEGLAWLSNDSIVYSAAEDGNVDIWSASVGRRTRRRLTSDRADDFHPSASADGRMIVFASTREGAPGIWSIDPVSGHQRRLTAGVDVRPSLSGDGRMLVFQRGGALDATRFTLWRLAIGQSAPSEVTAFHAMRPALSPDARSIAYYWMTAEAWMLAVSPTVGGRPERTLPISETHAARVVRWSPDGRALAFIDGAGGASNIWLQPIDGGPARKLTNFPEGRMTTFDWSPDGSRLAWTRVNEVRDVVTVDVGPEPPRQ